MSLSANHPTVPLIPDLGSDVYSEPGAVGQAMLRESLEPEFTRILSNQGLNLQINKGPWKDFTDSRVSAGVNLARTERALWLHFQIREPELRTQILEDQGPVYTDSCVEFFTTPPGFEPDYLNFEFNSAGFLLHFRGPDRHNRIPLGEHILKAVYRKPRIDGGNQGSSISWSLTVGIPAEVFGCSVLPRGLWKANFYKCGDGLEKLHYYSWATIKNPKPDFHLPEFFKFLEF